jgi:hypothetical protein
MSRGSLTRRMLRKGLFSANPNNECGRRMMSEVMSRLQAIPYFVAMLRPRRAATFSITCAIRVVPVLWYEKINIWGRALLIEFSQMEKWAVAVVRVGHPASSWHLSMQPSNPPRANGRRHFAGATQQSSGPARNAHRANGSSLCPTGTPLSAP